MESIFSETFLLEISTDTVRSAQVHLDSVKKKRQGGVASDFDVLRAEVELSNFQAELIQNRNAINVAKARLLKVMGVSQDSDFTLSTELSYVHLKMTMVTKQFCLALMNNEKTIGPVNLGNPNELNMLDLAEKVIKLTASKSKIIKLDLPKDDPEKRCPDISI